MQSNKRRVSVILPASIHKRFVARCREKRVYCQGAVRALAALYAAGKIEPLAVELPKKPKDTKKPANLCYTNWVDLRCDDALWAKIEKRLRERNEKLNPTIRGLIGAYIADSIPDSCARLVDTSEIVQLGDGGRGWVGRIVPRPAQKKAKA